MALLVALQLQVCVVEETYLYATHATHATEYAARTGRFLPVLGRVPAPIHYVDRESTTRANDD